MSGINVEFNSREIEAALGRVMAARVRRKAVNEAGSKARRDIPALLAEIYSTTKAGIGAKAKAAGPGSTDPVYRLRLNRQIRLGRLKSGARKFKAKRGARLGKLKLTQPQQSGARGVDVFLASRGEQRGEFILGASRGRKARRVGGPILRRALDTNPELAARRDEVREDLAAALAAGIEAALKGKGR